MQWACLTGTRSAGWLAGPGAWLHPASTIRRTHRNERRGPSDPLFDGIGGTPALSAFHLPKQVTTPMRELSWGTSGPSAETALSALIARRRSRNRTGHHEGILMTGRDVNGRDGPQLRPFATPAAPAQSAGPRRTAQGNQEFCGRRAATAPGLPPALRGAA